MGRCFRYYDGWETEILRCDSCGWEGTFREADVEVYNDLMDCECPKCPSTSHLAIVCFPSMEETEANWDKVSDADKKAHIDGKNYDAMWLESRLTSESELPDIDNESILLTWDEREGSAIILYNEQELWREPVFFEGYPRYEEVVEILRGKYGDRLADVIPTDRSIFNLYGDKIRADGIVGSIRGSLQRGNFKRIANHESEEELPGFSFFDNDVVEEIDTEISETAEVEPKEKETSMAFSTKIFCYPVDTAKSCVEVEPLWWDSRELRKDPRFVVCGINSVYHQNLSGISAAFGVDENRLLSFPPHLDWIAYAKARPLMVAALEKFEAAGKSHKEYLNYLYDNLSKVVPNFHEYLDYFVRELSGNMTFLVRDGIAQLAETGFQRGGQLF